MEYLEIDMSPRRGTACWYCEQECEVGYGLPINTNAELVSNEYQGEWGGVPSCKECFDKHAAGLLPVADEFCDTVWGVVQVGG